MKLEQSIKTCFDKTLDYQGRASRSEYWYWIFFSTILEIISYFISPYLTLAVSLVLFMPSLAVHVRRLHDINKSGNWYFIVLIPVIGPLILLFWMMGKGSAGKNRFDSDPVNEQSVLIISIVVPVILILIWLLASVTFLR